MLCRLSGSSPFLGDSQQETYHNITALNYDFDHDLFNGTSDLAKDFIEKLFIRNPRLASGNIYCHLSSLNGAGEDS